MIEGKVVRLLAVLCLAMAAAALWRVSLLSDWTQLPDVTGDGPRVRNSLVLFVPCLGLLFMMAVAFLSKWLMVGPKDAIEARQRANRPVWLAVGVLSVVVQAVILSRSLDAVPTIDSATLARGTMAIIGILVILRGNVLPKLPGLSTRFALLNLDSWRTAQGMRFRGYTNVVLGLAIVAVAALVPLPVLAPALLALTLTFLGAVIWHFIRLKTERAPPQP